MNTDPDKIKQRVQTIIVTCGVILMAGKFTAYFLTNSVGILTDAMESIVNVTAGFISLYAIRQAAKPKDEDHPFGHGKIELISASIEGILIFIAGGVIIYEGIQRLFTPSIIEKLDIGIVVIATAGVVNYLLGWYSIRQGKKYDSIALVAGGKHLQSDTYSTIGLVVGLIMLYFTGLAWIDSALAIIFGGIISFTGISILRKTINNLIDTADKEALEIITKSISENRKQDWIDIHNLKVLKYGGDYFIDCDLTLPWYYNITEGHQSCEELRMCLVKLFPQGALISIHSDSCLEKYCAVCPVKDCQYRKKAFTGLVPFTMEKLITQEES
ncbi:MAG: cation diffusion facilitator family transporter [Prevotella sp.]|jgi:cation diffusion facilitator family transporter|nr:cation diffusion facilitator family transporter [Prevotella sp.]